MQLKSFQLFVFYISRSFVCIFFYIAVVSISHFILIRLIFDMNIVIIGYRKVIVILRNMFQSIHSPSSVSKRIIKTVNILNLHVS